MMRFLLEDKNTIGSHKQAKLLKLEIVKEWDDNLGVHVYTLYQTMRFWGHGLGTKRVGLFKRVTERTNGQPRDLRMAKGSGDYDWAVRIARHHKLARPSR